MPCPHGRERYRCKDCGGKGICAHGRRRSTCKECGGSQICPHGRERYNCKECGGSSICPHGRRRSKCKECGGSSICPHGRQRNYCKECGGGSICAHGRQRSKCKECGGKSICPHGRVRNRCKECGGSEICPHGRVRSQCKECGGGSICAHGRRRSRCKECGGSQICAHGRIRSQCKECAQSTGRKRKAAEAVCQPADHPPVQGVAPPDDNKLVNDHTLVQQNELEDVEDDIQYLIAFTEALTDKTSKLAELALKQGASLREVASIADQIAVLPQPSIPSEITQSDTDKLENARVRMNELALFADKVQDKIDVLAELALKHQASPLEVSRIRR